MDAYTGGLIGFLNSYNQSPNIDIKAPVSTPTTDTMHKDFNIFYDAYKEAKRSSNPVYNFIDSYFVDKKFGNENFVKCVYDQGLLPEHFMGYFGSENVMTLPVIFYGILHILKNSKHQEMGESHPVTTFISTVVLYGNESGLPIFQKWNDFDVLYLIKLIKMIKKDDSISIAKMSLCWHRSSSEKAGLQFKSLFQQRLEELRRARNDFETVIHQIYGFCKSSNDNFAHLKKDCEWLAGHVSQHPMQMPIILGDIHCLIFILLSESKLSHHIRYMETLVNLKNTLISQNNAIFPFLGFLHQCENQLFLSLQNVEISPYIIKTLQNSKYNLFYLQEMCKNYGDKISNVWGRNDFMPVEDENLHNLLFRQSWPTAFLFRVSPLFLNAYRSLKYEKISQKASLLGGSIFKQINELAKKRKAESDAEFDKLVARYPKLSQYAYYGVTLEDFRRYLSQIDFELDTFIADEISEPLPSQMQIEDQNIPSPIAESSTSLPIEAAACRVEEAEINPWNDFYRDLSEKFLPLLKKKEILYGIEKSLAGLTVKFSNKTQIFLSKQMEELFKEYQKYASHSLTEANEVLMYFFKNELPQHCVKLFLTKSDSTHFQRMQFEKIIQTRAYVPTNLPVYSEQDPLLRPFVNQISKAMTWKKDHIRLWRSKEEEEESHLFVMVLTENQNEGLTILPGVFEFSSEFSLKRCMKDSYQIGQTLLEGICTGGLQVGSDGRIHLTTRQFDEFYTYLEKNGPRYNERDGREKEFLLITQGVTLKRKDLEQPVEETHHNIPFLDDCIQQRKKTAPVTTIKWAIPSLTSQSVFADKGSIFTYLQDGVAIVDGLKRKKDRRKILSRGEKVVHSSLSYYLRQAAPRYMPKPVYFCFEGLKPYQRESVTFLLKLKEMGLHGGLLGLDTGLGKTPTMIEFVAQLFKTKSAPVIFTGTKSTLLQSVDSFRNFMGMMILSELKGRKAYFTGLFQHKRVELAELQSMYAVLSFLPLSLLSARQNISSKRATGEKLIQKQNQLKWIENLQAEALRVRQEYAQIVFNYYQINLSNLDEGAILKHFSASLPQDGLWNFDLFKDIMAVETWDGFQVDASIKNKKAIFVMTLEAFKDFEKVQSLSPQALLIDEAQQVDNPDTISFQNLEKIVRTLQPKPFTVFASATLFEHHVGNLLTYLIILTPHVEANESIMPIADLNVYLPNELKKMAKKFVALCNAQVIKEDPTLFIVYTQLKNLFYKLEAFKKSLQDVTIRIRKEEPAVRAQWNNRIPIARRVSHSLQLTENQQARLNLLDAEFKQENACGFLEYHGKIYKTLFFPNILENGRGAKIFESLQDQSISEIREWAEAAPMLDYFLNDPRFEAESKEGALIFVHETLIGKIIRRCLAKKFNVKVDFLTGEDSALRRRQMAERFEKDLDGQPRIFLSNARAGSAGMDLKKNGKHVYFCYEDFSPKMREQGENRLIRVDSDKPEVFIHSFEWGIPYERLVKWHSQKKNQSEEYYFAPLRPELSNAHVLFGDLFNLVCFEVAFDQYTNEFVQKMKELKEIMLQFANEDIMFLEGLRDLHSFRGPILNSSSIMPQPAPSIMPQPARVIKRPRKQVQEVPLPNEKCLPNEKGKEKAERSNKARPRKKRETIANSNVEGVPDEYLSSFKFK